MARQRESYERGAEILSRGIQPKSIVAVTFTNKAAREMRERITQLLRPRKVSDMVVSTFHSQSPVTVNHVGEVQQIRWPHHSSKESRKHCLLQDLSCGSTDDIHGEVHDAVTYVL